MCDLSLILAALDPAGLFAAVCAIIWTLLCPTSCVAALVSVALCPFQRTASQALRLSKLGFWAGVIAFIVSFAATLATAGFPTNRPSETEDGLILDFLTALAPILAFFTGRCSRSKIARSATAPSAAPSYLMPSGVIKRSGVCDGEAFLASIEIPVWTLVHLRREGASDSALLQAYPNLNQTDLDAAWDYAHSHPDEIASALERRTEQIPGNLGPGQNS